MIEKVPFDKKLKMTVIKINSMTNIVVCIGSVNNDSADLILDNITPSRSFLNKFNNDK